MLGDIVINAEKAASQAREYGHTLERELAFLTIHSVLHLLGHEHENDDAGEKIMREKQTEILEKIGLDIK
jgi:probable rRNA maturation factor